MDPVRICETWTDELLLLMVERLVDRKSAGRPADDWVSDEVALQTIPGVGWNKAGGD